MGCCSCFCPEECFFVSVGVLVEGTEAGNLLEVWLFFEEIGNSDSGITP